MASSRHQRRLARSSLLLVLHQSMKSQLALAVLIQLVLGWELADFRCRGLVNYKQLLPKLAFSVT